MAAFAIGVTGVDLSAEGTSVAGFAPGTVVNLSDGGQAIYVKALSEISQFACVLIGAAATAQMSTTTLAVATKRVGFAQCSIASAFYGWVQMGGTPKVNLAANCAPSVMLFTTSVSGVLDDALVSAANVAGCVAQTTISNATAVTITAGYPHITFNGGL